MDMNEILDKVSSEHPYKIPGDRDSYSQYNEAWQDCIARIEQEVDVMKKENRFEFDFYGMKSFDCPCGRHYVNTASDDGWIPVEKELPDRENRVLCYFRYEPDSPDVICENRYIGSGKWQSDSDCVVAWRPLPEPYCPERSDNHDGE